MLVPEDLLKILLALVVGGSVGFERELHHKSAGLRTLIFICLGSTLFTILSVRLAGTAEDLTRIASGIVTGVGFLGAGVILHDGGHIKGLTTAATIWLVAALGVGIGAAQYALVAVVTVVTLLVLWMFPRLETWIDRRR